MEDNDGCLISIAESAFIIMVIANAFFSANIEWWVVFTPLALQIICDIIRLVLEMHYKSKNK